MIRSSMLTKAALIATVLVIGLTFWYASRTSAPTTQAQETWIEQSKVNSMLQDQAKLKKMILDQAIAIQALNKSLNDAPRLAPLPPVDPSLVIAESNKEDEEEEEEEETTVSPITTTKKIKKKKTKAPYSSKFSLDQLNKIHSQVHPWIRGRFPNSRYHNTSNIFTYDPNFVPHEHIYNFVIKPKIKECGSESDKLLLLAIFHISADFIEMRSVIRSVWTQIVAEEPSVRAIFAVGMSDRKYVNDYIRLEAQLYNDILQEDYVESYFNLTTKVLGGFKYVMENCMSNVEFVMRINDDIMINMPSLAKYLKSLVKMKQTNNLFLGEIFGGQPVVRDPVYKRFYVSYEQFPHETYLPYMGGSVYMFSIDLIPKVYDIARYVVYEPFSVWLEDVYFGMLCIHLQCEYVGLNDYMVWDTTPQRIYERINTTGIFFMMFETKDYMLIWSTLRQVMNQTNLQ